MRDYPTEHEREKRGISLFFSSSNPRIKFVRIIVYSMVCGGVFLFLEYLQSHVDHRINLQEVTILSDTFYESSRHHVEVQDNEALGTKLLIFKSYPNYLSEFFKGFLIFFLVSIFFIRRAGAEESTNENKTAHTNPLPRPESKF